MSAWLLLTQAPVHRSEALSCLAVGLVSLTCGCLLLLVDGFLPLALSFQVPKPRTTPFPSLELLWESYGNREKNTSGLSFPSLPVLPSGISVFFPAPPQLCHHMVNSLRGWPRPKVIC